MYLQLPKMCHEQEFQRSKSSSRINSTSPPIDLLHHLFALSFSILGLCNFRRSIISWHNYSMIHQLLFLSLIWFFPSGLAYCNLRWRNWPFDNSTNDLRDHQACVNFFKLLVCFVPLCLLVSSLCSSIHIFEIEVLTSVYGTNSTFEDTKSITTKPQKSLNPGLIIQKPRRE